MESCRQVKKLSCARLLKIYLDGNKGIDTMSFIKTMTVSEFEVEGWRVFVARV